MKLGQLVVKDEDAFKIAEALTETTLRILRLLSQERLDVSTIALKLGLSEAYISEQIKLLEQLKLVNVSYERGRRGIRKICESAVGKITIVIKP